MNQFHVSPLKRLLSRIYFYGSVVAGSFLVGNMIPSSSSNLEPYGDLFPAVAKAYCGVPLSEVPKQFLPIAK